jgi:hypothetical protein
MSIVFKPRNNILLIIRLINIGIPHTAHPNWKQATRKEIVLNGKTGLTRAANLFAAA